VVVLVFAGCASQTSYEGAKNFVEPLTVGEMMAQDNVVVIDARGAESYELGHLDGAINLPPSLLTVTEPVGGLVASKEAFEKVMNTHGIANEDTVFVYDDKGGVYSGRVWWVMKLYGHEDVRIINMGAKGLEKAGLPMSAAAVAPKDVNYVAKDADTAILASLDEVTSVAEGTSDAKLLDVRSRAEFDEGAIPSAVLYPHTENLYSDGSFKSSRTIELNYKDKGFEKEDEIILYCKSSFRATQTAALLLEAGYTNVKVYDGAWLEWENQGMPSEEAAPNVVPTSQDAS
jgi:thiosulfate/3-mercaptopyruvate sulfurtransferase